MIANPSPANASGERIEVNIFEIGAFARIEIDFDQRRTRIARSYRLKCGKPFKGMSRN